MTTYLGNTCLFGSRVSIKNLRDYMPLVLLVIGVGSGI